MADEEQYSPPEEYKSSENTDTSEAFGAESSVVRKKGGGMRRKMSLFLSLLIVVFLVYKFLGFFWGAKEVKRETPTPTKVTQLVQKPVVAKPTVDQFQILQQSLTDIADQGKTNASTMIGLQQQVKNTREDIDKLSQQLNDISDKLKKVIDKKPPVVAVKKRVRVRRRVRPPRRRIVRTQYYVQAAIPERAWLKSAKGSTITVSVGSKLPGYGAVVHIDPLAGVVITSSGRKIKYSPNDS